MRVDLKIEDEDGKEFLIDAKYKNLQEKNLAIGDFYQMFAYGTSQNKIYHDIILIYPKSNTLKHKSFEKTLNHKLTDETQLKIHIRELNVARIWSSEKKKFIDHEMICEFNRLFADIKKIENKQVPASQDIQHANPGLFK